MFKFDFKVDNIGNENPFQNKEIDVENAKTLTDNSIEWYKAEEIIPSKDMLEHLDICKLNSTERVVNDTHITHMVSGFVLEDIKDHKNGDLDIKKAEDQHSDLIPGVYEGGAKIWECTEDLLNYLSKNFSADKWSSSQVLDLGCGSGILGIFAFLNGATVTFQDYNKDVLQNITIPNVILNTQNAGKMESKPECFDVKELEGKARFFSGDWEKWNQLSTDLENFDIILTSETIYNPTNQEKLLNCICDKLKPNGIVLIAAKTYYFGVGGGLRQFENLLKKDKRLKYKVVWQSNEGVNREIVELIKS